MKFPTIIPKGSKIYITQYFNYHPVNNPMGHNGIDFVPFDPTRNQIDNKFVAYGSIFAMDRETTCAVNDIHSPMNEIGNGVRVEWKDGEWIYSVVFWHAVNSKVTAGQVIKAGQEIARMGNTGQVVPKVTTDQPVDGTHCHFTLQRMHRNANGNYNIEYLNPLDYFDINNPVGYTDEGIITKEDGEPLKWVFEKLGLKTAWEKLLYILKLTK